MPKSDSSIRIRGAAQNNLQDVDADIPLDQLTVITGPSGSGKSSLAFQTLYAEGQRRYVETFSPYMRQFFDRMDKPRVERIEGIPPAIAIEQVNQVRSARSTVGTITEINDYLKLLFARIAHGFCPSCGQGVRPETVDDVVKAVGGGAALVTFPVPVAVGLKPEDVFTTLREQGWLRVYMYGEVVRTDETEDFTRKSLPAVLDIVADRVKGSAKKRLREAVERAFRHGNGRLKIIDSETGKVTNFSTHWHCASCDVELRPPEAALFSFNSSVGACPKCRGFGKTLGLDLGKAIPDETVALKDGAVRAFQGETYAESQRDLLRCARKQGIPVNVPVAELTKAQRKWLLDGEKGDPDELYERGEWYGVRGFFSWLESRAYKMHVRVFLSRFRSQTECPDCGGARLVPAALAYRALGFTLPELWAKSAAELSELLQDVEAGGDPGLKTVLSEVHSRLRCMVEVGLGYLTLDRATRTLSGGEIARVNLTSCLGASLTGALFVLDEPTIGLHARDVSRLTGVLGALRDRGNTVVIVEHDAEVMRSADYLIDMGPGRGSGGGRVVGAGPMKRMLAKKRGEKSLTLAYLTGEKTLESPEKRFVPRDWVTVKKAAQHNLKGMDVRFPLGVFCCVTGVSGSGKSTLAHQVLYRHLAKLRGLASEEMPGRASGLVNGMAAGPPILVDQSPIARTPRSCPALYSGVYDIVRKLFTETPDARERSLEPGYFSFNTGAGRCQRCWGTGFEKIEMQFLSDIYVTCAECDGRRFQPEAQRVKLHGKSVADVLEMTVAEAVEFFERVPGGENVALGLKPMAELGLDYLRLGQPLNTISGGEAQRLKLVFHLREIKGEPCFFICDEPTTGLHFDDIRLLLKVLRRLVEHGHTVLVIEHNLDVIRHADWVIDMGPEAGEQGGGIVAEGTPEDIMLCQASHTGRWLKDEGAAPRVAETPAAYREATNRIEIRGAREHNLKNLDISIPRDEFVVITGLSGSGKSTLAFDIVFAEGQRRFLDIMSPYARQFAEMLEKPDIDSIRGLPPTVAIEQRVSQGGGKSTVATITEVWHFLRLLYAKVGTQHCPDCGGAVRQSSVSEAYEAILRKWKEGETRVMAPVVKGRKGFHTDVAEWAARRGYEIMRVDGKLIATADFKPLARYKAHEIEVVALRLPAAKKPVFTEAMRAVVDEAMRVGKGEIRLLNADQTVTILSTERACAECGRAFEVLDPRHFSYNSPHGWCRECRGYGFIKKGMGLDMNRAESVLDAELASDAKLERVDEEEIVVCHACDGQRLKPESLHVRVNGLSIGSLSSLSASAASAAVAGLPFQGRDAVIARDIIPEITQRLAFMEHVGLGYLELDRSARTLSGGEAQRIRLAAQLGSNLRGVLYVLDEPTIGLHPRDNTRLLNTLEALKERGNSLLVVEHDEDTMKRADTIIDMGPGAGQFGGTITSQGRWEEVIKSEDSSTARHLRAPVAHPWRGERRRAGEHGWLTIKGAKANNLRNVDADIPLGCLTVLTGVSGAGKSSLMRGVLLPAAQTALSKKRRTASSPWDSVKGMERLTAVYEVDQSPIGKTSRSTPATYVKVFDEIRKLFAAVPEARMRGYEAGRFSFNNESGRCEVCGGNGLIKHEMAFLPTSHTQCEACGGRRYNEATLEILYHEKSIADVMEMTMREAAEFFASTPRVATPLRLLSETGCGYLRLGQPSPTLSGGEAQRVKLVAELTRGVNRARTARMKGAREFKGNLYLIEEPTIGLHMEDVGKLVDVLHRLVDEGHTVVVIEHNLDVIAEADHILDVGPEAGAAGGRIVFEGTPEAMAERAEGETAPYVRAMLTN